MQLGRAPHRVHTKSPLKFSGRASDLPAKHARSRTDRAGDLSSQGERNNYTEVNMRRSPVLLATLALAAALAVPASAAAATATATGSVTGSTLSVTTSAAPSFSANLDAGDQT